MNGEKTEILHSRKTLSSNVKQNFCTCWQDYRTTF